MIKVDYFRYSIFLVLFTSLTATAEAELDMDHVNPQGQNLYSPSEGSVMSVLNDFREFSSMVIDDFVASGDVVSQVQVVFEADQHTNLAPIEGWQVSIWSSIADAATSGNTLSENTVTGAFLLGSHESDMVIVSGTQGNDMVRQVSFAGLNLTGLTIGAHYWIGIAPRYRFTDTGGTFFMMGSKQPAILGAGTADDAYFVNPGQGFGQGTNWMLNYNAAYSVTTVPEPSLALILSSGLLLLRRRRLT